MCENWSYSWTTTWLRNVHPPGQPRLAELMIFISCISPDYVKVHTITAVDSIKGAMLWPCGSDSTFDFSGSDIIIQNDHLYLRGSDLPNFNGYHTPNSPVKAAVSSSASQ